MDMIDGMRSFAAVVDCGSFTRAADRLGISKKLVSKYVAQLEDRLGSRLLHRTTRSLSLTETGRLYHDRCVQLLDDLDELEDSIQARTTQPKGRLFVTAPAALGESRLMDMAAEFCTLYPQVDLDLSLTDRYVNLVEEGIDLALRIGRLEDSSLIARRLAPVTMAVCAAPDYLDRHGTPAHPRELSTHLCIIDTNLRSGARWPFEEEGEGFHVTVAGRLSVNNPRAALHFARCGGGIALCPRYIAAPELSQGSLVTILDEYLKHDLTLNAVYNNTRHLAPKVRAFVDFLAKSFKERPDWERTPR